MKHPDPIIDEIRAVRDAMAKDSNYDVEEIARKVKAHQTESGRKVVRRPPRPLTVVKKAS